MNVPRAIEIAFAGLVRKYGEVGPGVNLVCWQAPRAFRPTRPDPEETRVFPLIQLAASPPQTDDDGGATLYSDLAVICATKLDDDIEHAMISSMYAGTQAAADELYKDAREDEAPVEGALADFIADVAAEIGQAITVGGVTFGAALTPYDDAGALIIGFSIRIHYSRPDF